MAVCGLVGWSTRHHGTLGLALLEVSGPCQSQLFSFPYKWNWVLKLADSKPSIKKNKIKLKKKKRKKHKPRGFSLQTGIVILTETFRHFQHPLSSEVQVPANGLIC